MTALGRTGARFRALLSSSHPGPTVVVTLIGVLLGIAVGLDPLRLVLLGLTVLFGQLSIGFSNDAIDAERDRRSGRSDKPVARGDISVRTVRAAAVLSVLTSVLCSAPLGVLALAAHLVLVAGGWLYNAGVKKTPLSVLPFVLSFGILPLVAALSRPEPALAAGWALAMGALLGVAAHMTNVLSDLAEDAASGVRGLPHRLGVRGSLLTAGGAVLLAALLGAVAPGLPPSLPSLLNLGVAAGLTVVLLSGIRRGIADRSGFRIIMAVALTTVVSLALGGDRLVIPV